MQPKNPNVTQLNPNVTQLNLNITSPIITERENISSQNEASKTNITNLKKDEQPTDNTPPQESVRQKKLFIEDVKIKFLSHYLNPVFIHSIPSYAHVRTILCLFCNTPLSPFIMNQMDCCLKIYSIASDIITRYENIIGRDPNKEEKFTSFLLGVSREAKIVKDQIDTILSDRGLKINTEVDHESLEIKYKFSEPNEEDIKKIDGDELEDIANNISIFCEKLVEFTKKNFEIQSCTLI